MPRFETALIAEFVQESLELLSQLGAACGELSESRDPDAQLATIDRGLHTIKGNAAALGFTKLSRAAGRILDEVRRESPSSSLSADCKGRIWKFLVDCRKYLAHVGNERAPGEELLSPDAASGEDIEGLSLSSDLPVALEAREFSIDEILAAVPKELNPDVGRLIGQPRRSTPPVSIPPAMPATPAKSAPSKKDDSQALRAAAQLRRLKAHAERLRGAGISEDELLPIREFLTQLRDQSRLVETAPMERYLQSVVDDVAELGEEMGVPISPVLTPTKLQVLPALGALIRHQLTEMVRLRLEVAMKNGRSLELGLEAIERDERLELKLNGLAFAGRPSALERVRLQASLEFLDDLDGNVRNDSTDGALVLSLSVDGLFSVALSTVHSKDGRYCLPSERIESQSKTDSGVELVVSGEKEPLRIEVDSVTPPEEMLVVASPEDPFDEGLLGYALSFAASERIPVLDPDSL